MQIGNSTGTEALYQQYRSLVDTLRARSSGTADAEPDTDVSQPVARRREAETARTADVQSISTGTPQVEKQTQILAQEYGTSLDIEATEAASVVPTSSEGMSPEAAERIAARKKEAAERVNDPEYMKKVTEGIHRVKALRTAEIRRDYTVEALPSIRDYAAAHKDEWMAAASSIGKSSGMRWLDATDHELKTAVAGRQGEELLGLASLPKSTNPNGTDLREPQSVAEQIFRMIASPEDQAKFDSKMASIRPGYEAKVKAIEEKGSPVYANLEDSKAGRPPVMIIY